MSVKKEILDQISFENIIEYLKSSSTLMSKLLSWLYFKLLLSFFVLLPN